LYLAVGEYKALEVLSVDLLRAAGRLEYGRVAREHSRAHPWPPRACSEMDSSLTLAAGKGTEVI
jgi:hypothetical protein